MTDSQTDRLRALHASGTFVIPNPFDRGSARLLAALGFEALATTSLGLATSLGKLDMTISRDDLLRHVEDLAAATDLPLHVDSERCFADDAAGVAETVRLLVDAGAAGCSIEDWDPATGAIDPIEVSVERVAAAVEAASASGLVLTARCEHHFHGIDDIDGTIARLQAYRDAGADVVYAPALMDLDRIRRVVDECGVATNVLLLPGGPSVGDLAGAGVRRVSLGSALSSAAYGAMAHLATAIRDDGRIDPGGVGLDARLAATAFLAEP